MLFKRPPSKELLIYAVDDDDMYLKLIPAGLQKIGFSNVKTFHNGEECLLAMSENKPDCVILDYLLEGKMNGGDILRRISKDYPDVYVIILSGQEDVNVATSMIRQGAIDYVAKNDMSFFNIGSTLNRLKRIVNDDIVAQWNNRKVKALLLLSLAFVWVIGSLLIYIKIKSGTLF